MLESCQGCQCSGSLCSWWHCSPAIHGPDACSSMCSNLSPLGSVTELLNVLSPFPCRVHLSNAYCMLLNVYECTEYSRNMTETEDTNSCLVVCMKFKQIILYLPNPTFQS